MNAFATPAFSPLHLLLSALVGGSVAVISHIFRSRRNRVLPRMSKDSPIPEAGAVSSRTPIVKKTIVDADGLRRLVIFERANRTFGFFSQSRREMNEDWPPRFFWSEGGVYDSVETAEREAAVGSGSLMAHVTVGS